MLNRRNFLIAGAAAVPFFIGGCTTCCTKRARRPTANEKVNLAIIGCGTEAYDNVPQFLYDERVRITVVCDPIMEAMGYGYSAKQRGGTLPFKEMIDKKYGNNDCRMVKDFREVLADPTIDAVAVITPDHWHAYIAIAAMRAGKHVYCQKPMSLSIGEGQAMVKVWRETGVTFQVGNQGRSSSSSRVLAEWAVNGYLGKIQNAEVCIPGGSGGSWKHTVDPSPVALPSYFSREMWDLWQGPAEHWENNAFIHGIHDPMCWRWNKRYGGGMITDFGAHEIDLLHQCFGADRTGPVRIENFKCDKFQPNREVFSWAGEFSFYAVYANGMRATVRNCDKDHPRGVTIWGNKGTASKIGNSLNRPDYLKKWNEKKDLKPSDRALYKPDNGHSHEMDFIDGIYGDRPICTDTEIGHRTISVAHLANLCERLGVARLDWDPVREAFVGANAAAANELKTAKYHNGWKLDV